MNKKVATINTHQLKASYFEYVLHIHIRRNIDLMQRTKAFTHKHIFLMLDEDVSCNTKLKINFEYLETNNNICEKWHKYINKGFSIHK